MKTIQIIILVNTLVFALISMEPAVNQKRSLSREMSRFYEINGNSLQKPYSLDDFISLVSNRMRENKNNRFTSFISSLISENDESKESGNLILNPFYRFRK